MWIMRRVYRDCQDVNEKVRRGYRNGDSSHLDEVKCVTLLQQDPRVSTRHEASLK